MELSKQDRLAIVEATGYFYETAEPDEKPFARELNALASQIALSASGGLTIDQLQAIRLCLEIFAEDFPDDSQPQQSLLARLPALPPFA